VPRWAFATDNLIFKGCATPVPVLYNWPTVLASLFAVIFASGVALFVVSRSRMDWGQALAGAAGRHRARAFVPPAGPRRGP
jgi:hypothetical protein